MLKTTLNGLGGLISRRKKGVIELGEEKDQEWWDAHYDDKWKNGRPDYSKSPYYFLWAVIADRVTQLESARVLEIGCGGGLLAQLLWDCGIDAYTGFDLSCKAIEFARANVPRGAFHVEDALTTNLYDDASYNVVVCTEVLEHIQDDLGIVSRVRPGVRCVFSVPNFAHPSHVRTFASCEEVLNRYGEFFTGLRCIAFKSPRYSADIFFLADGITRERDE